MNPDVFFKELRLRNSGIFGTSLSQNQVDGCISLIDACEGFSIHHAAHVLAEVYHETGGGMMPVKETVYPYSKDRSPSDARVKKRLDRAWAKGQLPWVKSAYWREGWFGRGQIQLTHKYNYEKGSAVTGVDMVADPSKALELKCSAKIAAQGCRAGIFRGRKLADFDKTPGYLGAYDHAAARNIVNGDARSVGPKIAKYAHAFTAALKAADWGIPMSPPDVEPLEPPSPPEIAANSPDGWLEGLLSLFKRKSK